MHVAEVPGPGGAQGDPARAGAAQLPAHKQKPGAEDGRGVGPLHIVEEGGIEWSGGIVEGEEDDAPAAAHRRGLHRGLHSRDEDLRLRAQPEEVTTAHQRRPQHRECIEHRRVEVDDVVADVEAEDLELGAHPISRPKLRQPGDRRRGIAGEALEGELLDVALSTRATRSPAGEVGHLEQQVAAGDATTTAHAHALGRDRVEGVEGASEHEPLGDRLAHRGAVPEVRERGVGAPLDDALHLGLAHALDVSERQPDAIGIIGCPLDGIRRAGTIDVEAEDRNA